MVAFHALFAGRDDCYGTYRLPKGKAEKGEKLLGKAETVKSPVTRQHYDDHLAGKGSGLGIVPVMLDGKCWFTAIDLDVYDQPDLHKKVDDKILKLQLPMIPTYTKSGGIHIWLFFKEPVDAEVAIEATKKFNHILGFKGKLPNGKIKENEIFPKQTSVKKRDQGNWINLPYYGGQRKAFRNGQLLDLDDFLELAEEMALSPEDLEPASDAAEQATGDTEDDNEAPPCIQAFMRDKVYEGGRDNVLFHVGVYLQRAYPDSWQDKLHEWNQEFCEPPQTAREVSRVVVSLERKTYQYKCKDQPMAGCCDKPTCLKRKFGVGNVDPLAGFVFDRIKKIDSDPPIYDAVVDGTAIRMSFETLLSQRLFRIAVAQKLNKLIAPMKTDKWEQMLNDLLSQAEIEDAPEDVSVSGQIMQVLIDWTSRTLRNANEESRVVKGFPFYDIERKTLMFRGIDFLAQVAKFKAIDSKMIWHTLRGQGAEEQSLNSVKVWAIAVAEPWFELPGKEKEQF